MVGISWCLQSNLVFKLCPAYSVGKISTLLQYIILQLLLIINYFLHLSSLQCVVAACTNQKTSHKTHHKHPNPSSSTLVNINNALLYLLLIYELVILVYLRKYIEYDSIDGNIVYYSILHIIYIYVRVYIPYNFFKHFKTLHRYSIIII